MSQENKRMSGPVSDDDAPTSEAGYDLNEVSDGDPDLNDARHESENADLPIPEQANSSGVVDHQMITANISGH